MNNAHVFKSIFILLALLFTLGNHAYADCQPNIKIENFWVVQPPEIARRTAGYGVIKNTGNAADTLLKVSSNAGSVMMHKTEITSGIAKMIHLSGKVIEAGSELVFKPMSYHLMFSDLAESVYHQGEEVTLTFEFEQSGIIKVEVPVRASWE